MTPFNPRKGHLSMSLPGRNDAVFTVTLTLNCECLTCGHVDQDTLARPQIGHLKQHHVGGQVVYRQSGTFLKAHLLRHGEGVDGGHNNHILPHATAPHHDDTIPHLREDRRREREGWHNQVTGVIGMVVIYMSHCQTETLQQQKYVFSNLWYLSIESFGLIVQLLRYLAGRCSREVKLAKQDIYWTNKLA